MDYLEAQRQSYTEAAQGIVLAVEADSDENIYLWHEGRETHEISLNRWRGEYELNEMWTGEIVAAGSLVDVAIEAVKLELSAQE